MTTWTFADGTELRTGGHVVGLGPIAAGVLALLKESPAVRPLPHPMEAVPLDPSSDYLLDLFARDAARHLKTTVSTEYEPDEDDAPPGVRDCLRRWRRDSLDVFVGTVH